MALRFPGSRVCVNLLLIVFLAIQLVLPLRGFVHDKIETRGNFTWNMYSKRYWCSVRYLLWTPGYIPEPIDHTLHFTRRNVVMNVFHRRELPTFHEFLCAYYEARGRAHELYGSVTCSVNDGPQVDLVPLNTLICSAENYGVVSVSGGAGGGGGE